MLRDDRPGVPWRGCWNLPGGGRVGLETTDRCALWEVLDEAGLRIRPTELPWRHRYAWFLVARIDSVAGLRLRPERQAPVWVTPGQFMDRSAGIAHHEKRLADYLREAEDD